MIQKCSLWNVLSVFFNEPLKIHFIKEIARKINLAPTSIRQHLKSLLKENLILKKKGEMFFGFIANRDNNDFLFYKKIDNMIKLKESGLLDYLITSYYPQAIVVYGSYFRGEDVETSDIDLLILAKVKKEPALEKFEGILKRGIHLMIKPDMKNLTAELRSEIINGLVLYGYLRH